MIDEIANNREYLETVSFFTGFSEEQKNRLAAQMIQKVYAKGQTIIH